VADAPAAAARVLRVALLASVAAAFVGVILDPLVLAVTARQVTDVVGAWFRGSAIAIVIATPFLVLVLLAALERGRRLGWYAAGTLLIALGGILLVG
jgi:integral membrane sensor domain MASE1